MDKMTKSAQNLRKKATPQENKLWYEFLKDYDVPIHRQKVKGNYVLDFYCSKAKLAIELDGSGHYFKGKSIKDEERTQALEDYGIEVIRFGNNDVTDNFYGVCTAIDEKIKERIDELKSEP